MAPAIASRPKLRISIIPVSRVTFKIKLRGAKHYIHTYLHKLNTMHKSIPSAHQSTLNSISPKQNYRNQVFCEPTVLRCIIRNIKAARLQSSAQLSINALKKSLPILISKLINVSEINIKQSNASNLYTHNLWLLGSNKEGLFKHVYVVWGFSRKIFLTMSHKTVTKLKYNVLLIMVFYLIMTEIKLYKYFTKYLLKPYTY